MEESMRLCNFKVVCRRCLVGRRAVGRHHRLLLLRGWAFVAPSLDPRLETKRILKVPIGLQTEFSTALIFTGARSEAGQPKRTVKDARGKTEDESCLRSGSLGGGRGLGRVVGGDSEEGGRVTTGISTSHVSETPARFSFITQVVPAVWRERGPPISGAAREVWDRRPRP